MWWLGTKIIWHQLTLAYSSQHCKPDLAQSIHRDVIISTVSESSVMSKVSVHRKYMCWIACDRRCQPAVSGWPDLINSHSTVRPFLNYLSARKLSLMGHNLGYYLVRRALWFHIHVWFVFHSAARAQVLEIASMTLDCHNDRNRIPKQCYRTRGPMQLHRIIDPARIRSFMMWNHIITHYTSAPTLTPS